MLMRSIFLSCGLIFSLVWATIVKAQQDPSVGALDLTNGLPQSFISGLVQDGQGFIWIGTRGGLARYDGHAFRIFKHFPFDQHGLTNNIITDLTLDRHQQLWIQYEPGGMDRLDTRTERITRNEDTLLHKTSRLIRNFDAIATDRSGRIWMVDRDSLLLCDPSTKKIIYVPTIAYEGDYRINRIIAGFRHDLLAVTTGGLLALDWQAGRFRFRWLFRTNKSWINPNVYTFANGSMLVGANGRLLIFDDGDRLLNTIPMPNDQARPDHFCKFGQNAVLFAFQDKIYRIDADGTLKLLRALGPAATSNITRLLYDRSGVLWVGTNGGGIKKFDLRLQYPQSWRYQRHFTLDLWRKLMRIPLAEIDACGVADLNDYEFKWVTDQHGATWFCKAGGSLTDRPLLFRICGRHMSAPAWYYVNGGIDEHRDLACITINAKGDLVGLDYKTRPVYFDTISKKVIVGAPLILNTGLDIKSLLIEGENDFWFTTVGEGLFHCNRLTHAVKRYPQLDKPGALPTGHLMNIIRDPIEAQYFWIATLGGGLVRLDRLSGKSLVFTTRNGLPDNTIYSVMADETGNLWCSSNHGLFALNKNRQLEQAFTQKDGLISDEFNRFHFYRLRDGRLVYGGLQGYTVIDPLKLAVDNYQAPVVITDLRVNGHAADYGVPGSPLSSAIHGLDELRLTYRQNFLSFSFAALEYNNPAKLNYRYRLTDYDNGWNEAGRDHTATYTDLPPGNYTLEIQSTNAAMRWTGVRRKLHVIIEPPFWGTWWFRTMVGIILVALGYAAYRLRIRAVRREEQQKLLFERKAIELEAQAMRARMNPHFIFNCLNSIKLLILEKDVEKSISYLSTFAQLIRNQLNNGEREITLFSELETCRLYLELESLRFGPKISYQFEIDPNVDLHSLTVPPLIVQPFIENAIWHGIVPRTEGGSILIQVSLVNNTVSCAIDDNGIGRQRSKEMHSKQHPGHASKGMELVKTRVDLDNLLRGRNAAIKIIDKFDELSQSAGTRVVINFNLDD